MKQTIEEIESRNAVLAAQVNQKYNFSEIVGIFNDKNVHHIAERMGQIGKIRLKTVSYQYFRSEKELIAYCSRNKIKLKLTSGASPAEVSKPEEKKKAPPPAAEWKPPAELPPGLNEKQFHFCNEYLRLHNATRAFMIAFPTAKNANSAGACANALLKKPAVKAYLESMKAR